MSDPFVEVESFDEIACDLIHLFEAGLVIYLLSFVHVGTYWNNHHHRFRLFQVPPRSPATVKKDDGDDLAGVHRA